MNDGILYPYNCENEYHFNNDTNGCFKDNECDNIHPQPLSIH